MTKTTNATLNGPRTLSAACSSAKEKRIRCYSRARYMLKEAQSALQIVRDQIDWSALNDEQKRQYKKLVIAIDATACALFNSTDVEIWDETSGK